MKNINLIITTISLLAITNFSYAGYNGQVNGFYLKHFAKPKDLSDSSCKQFLGQVYRGGQPVFDGSDAWLKKIKESNIKMVFDLRSETGNAQRERDMLLKNGIAYAKLPLNTSGNTQPTNFTIEIAYPASAENENPNITKMTMNSTDATMTILNLMEEKLSSQNSDGIYLHCQRGEDRTGLMIALLRNCSGNGWKSEFNEYGGVMYKPLQQLMTDINKKRK